MSILGILFIVRLGNALKTTLKIDDVLNNSKSAITDTLAALNIADSSDYHLALINLLNETTREINRLESNKYEITLTSIHVRNIFELYLLTKHILSDGKAFKCWMGQLPKDISDFTEGFISLFKKYGKTETGLDAVINNINTSINDGPYTPKGPFNMKELARKYGLEEDYSAIHKLCSKIVHPSSMKVNTYQILVANDNYNNSLLYAGAHFSRLIGGLCRDIKEKIE
jgi:DNA-directed RNA polymerase subunit L